MTSAMLASPREIEKAIAEEFDGSACDYCCRYKKEGLSRSSRILMTWLVEEELSGKTLLDMGCGAGSFAIEALKNGASSCVGVDLSPGMIRTAASLAAEVGVQSRAKFEVGNVALGNLGASDIVVMDKVLCCYPEVEPLVRNAASASRQAIGFVVPRNEGLWKWPLRLAARIDNLVRKWRKHRPSGFYVHSLKTIDKSLSEAGFMVVKKRASRIWLVFLYWRSDLGMSIEPN